MSNQLMRFPTVVFVAGLLSEWFFPGVLPARPMIAFAALAALALWLIRMIGYSDQ